MSTDHERLTECLEQRVGAWFAGEGREQVSDRVYLRQMNMAVALALSRWLELADHEDGVTKMRAWLADVERRALTRKADARAEAIRQVREWLKACG